MSTKVASEVEGCWVKWMRCGQVRTTVTMNMVMGVGGSCYSEKRAVQVVVVPLWMCLSDGIYCTPFCLDTTCAKLSWPAMAEEAAEKEKHLFKELRFS